MTQVQHSGSEHRVHVAIIGAGIGGLATAVALSKAGLHVEVFEQVRRFKRVGAGLQLAPNATAALHGLGLLTAVRATASRPTAWRSYDAHTGTVTREESLGDDIARRYGTPYLHIHRGDLHDVLADAARAVCTVHRGRRLTGLTMAGEQVHLSFEDGGRAHADAVIGADGIHSTVRGVIFGGTRPRFSGMVAYRGLIPRERIDRLGVGPEAAKWWGEDRHLVHYWVSGGAELNYVAPIPATEWTEESWTAAGSIADLVAALDDFVPQVGWLVAQTGALMRSALYDRDPLLRWTADRVTLLGDAAHPMLPFMAQGSAMALEDAAVLSRCLQGVAADELPAALTRYERARIARTGAIQAGSRANTFLRSARAGTKSLTVQEVYAYDPWRVPLSGATS
ncbi:FAD-dependent monooxygenase [Actinoallomurus rhizosphaericola]|uniref:FAD-dependent monooxygenase n=1 Tax=Actinoallomurus rhizosphaericola TaxID=2952536 RepID=UPI002092ECD8|nr:FAD-dependent monooxygenase [Actinoallomurus rhizosphaericola]MCO5998974.1 FAD-dependent monooxygenase [Actinoallomurus rhizosphaericola]